METGARSLDCHSAFLLQHWELSSQAGDLATPWCRRCHLPNVLLSGVLASGLKRTSCTWQLKSITAVTRTYAHSLGWRWILAPEGGWASGQQASLTCPCFPLGKGIPGLAWPEMALGSRMVPGSTGIHSSQVQLTQKDAKSFNWVCQGLVASLDFFEVTGRSPTSSKPNRSLMLFYAAANRLPAKREISK